MIIDSLCLGDDGLFQDQDAISKSDKKGIAIGSLFSQFNGNFYLSSFCHWLKEEKKIKYLRVYCDDIIILGAAKEELHLIRCEIQQYLEAVLKLNLKNNYQVFPVDKRGVDFLGYRHFRRYILLRKTVSKNMIRKIRDIIKKLKTKPLLNESEWCSINSFKGWLKWANCYNLYKKWIIPLEGACEDFYNSVIKNKRRLAWPIQ